MKKVPSLEVLPMLVRPSGGRAGGWPLCSPKVRSRAGGAVPTGRPGCSAGSPVTAAAARRLPRLRWPAAGFSVEPSDTSRPPCGCGSAGLTAARLGSCECFTDRETPLCGNTLLNPLLSDFWVARRIVPGYLVLPFPEENAALNRKSNHPNERMR